MAPLSAASSWGPGDGNTQDPTPVPAGFYFYFYPPRAHFGKKIQSPVKDQPPNNKPKVFLGWAVQIPSPGAGSIWGCHIEIFLAGSKDKTAAPGVLHGF